MTIGVGAVLLGKKKGKRRTTEKKEEKPQVSISFSLFYGVSNLSVKLLLWTFLFSSSPAGFKCANHSCNVATRRSLRQVRANNSRKAWIDQAFFILLFFFFFLQHDALETETRKYGSQNSAQLSSRLPDVLLFRVQSNEKEPAKSSYVLHRKWL